MKKNQPEEVMNALDEFRSADSKAVKIRVIDTGKGDGGDISPHIITVKKEDS